MPRVLRPPTTPSPSGPSAGSLLDVVIVSRDSACLLDALLRSLADHVQVAHRTHVLYRATQPSLERGYDAVRIWHPEVRFIDDAFTFTASLRRLLHKLDESGSRFVLLLGDGPVANGPVDEAPLHLLSEGPAYRAVDLTDETTLDGTGRRATLSLAGQVFRTRDLLDVTLGIQAAGPDELERALAQGAIAAFAVTRSAAPCLARFARSPRPDDIALNVALLTGFQVDLSGVQAAIPTVPVRLVADQRPRPTPEDPIRPQWRPQQQAGGEIVGTDGTHSPDQRATAIWALCDGTRTEDEIIAELAHDSALPAARWRRLARRHLEAWVEQGLLAPARPESAGETMRTIDLRQVPCFVINLEKDAEKRRSIQAHLDALGFRYEIVRGLAATPSWVGVALSHLRVLRLSRAQVPFLVLEDDCRFTADFDPVIALPAEADAYSLGLSVCGLETPGTVGWGVPGTVQSEPYTADYLRVFNMLARHAVLYLSTDYCEKVIESQVAALTHRSCWHPGDIGCALQHNTSIVLAPNRPVCRQVDRDATARSLREVDANLGPVPVPPAEPLPAPESTAPGRAPDAKIEEPTDAAVRGPAPGTSMVSVTVGLAGGHRFTSTLPADSPLLAPLRASSQHSAAAPLVQLPLDDGRSALSFPIRRLRSVHFPVPGKDLPSAPLAIEPPPCERAQGAEAEHAEATKPAHGNSATPQGYGPRTNTNEGHLGGYIRASPTLPDYHHGDWATWTPALWEWAVETFAARSVLDVGCGEGHAAEHFASLGCRVRGVDGSRQARDASRIPLDHRLHDYTQGPYVPRQAYDLVWSCEFVEHVEERFTHHFLATFAAARRAVLLTYAAPGQPGWHHVNCQPRDYWVDKMRRMGFRLDEALTGEARQRAGDGHFAHRGLVFVREAPVPTVLSGPEIAPSAPTSRAPADGHLPIHAMKIARDNGLDFYLFLDIFVHPSRKKIVAVAPFYGDDWAPAEHGVDLEAVELVIDDLRVRGQYLPHRLDSWEPCILFDFEGDALTARLEDQPEISFTIEAGRHRESFQLSTVPAPSHDVALSLVIRNENRWLPHFLAYYLDCMAADHVWIYDNADSIERGADRATADREALLEILAPYFERGQVTYIPWHVRWRNRPPAPKMIGQPPQEAHSLNRFAHSRWIGFFDVDELLRIPGHTLSSFLAQYDHAAVDALSFGLRWFLHHGETAFEAVRDPPLTFLHARRDELGRKRQKLFVRPGEVRFLRLHFMEEGRSELPVDDTDIFFHHYVIRPQRFARGKTQASEPGVVRDPFMLRFRDRLALDVTPRESQAPATRFTAPQTRDPQTCKPQLLATRPDSAEAWARHIDQAWTQAEAGRSKLSADALAIRGMCGTSTRHFYNVLCALDECHFLEVGSWQGASLCAAIAGNSIQATAIENWSRFDGTRQTLEHNLSHFRDASRVRVIEADAFKVDPHSLDPVDIFLYDGDHRRASHRRALEHFLPALAALAVVIIDDWNWARVREGTEDALARLPVEVIHRREVILPDSDVVDMPRHAGRHTWWNGICVLLLRTRRA